MAATVAALENLGFAGPGGPIKYAEVTLDSAYASGGESVNATLFGFKTLKAVFIASNASGYLIEAAISSDKTSVTFKVYVTINTTTSQATPTDASIRDLSTMTIPVLVRGV